VNSGLWRVRCPRLRKMRASSYDPLEAAQPTKSLRWSYVADPQETAADRGLLCVGGVNGQRASAPPARPEQAVSISKKIRRSIEPAAACERRAWRGGGKVIPVLGRDDQCEIGGSGKRFSTSARPCHLSVAGYAAPWRSISQRSPSRRQFDDFVGAAQTAMDPDQGHRHPTREVSLGESFGWSGAARAARWAFLK